MLDRNQIILVKEGWANNLLTKYKDKFVEFFKKLKHQFEYNATARDILREYIKTGSITKEDSKELKTISTDLLKMVGLSSIALIPIPGGILLMLFLINSAKNVGIDLIPSHFESIASVDFDIKVNTEDEDGDRTDIVIFNKNPEEPYLIGKLTYEKIWNGLDMMGLIDEDEYYKIFPDDEYIKIEHVKVEKKYAQKGFGRILMDRALDEIRKTDFKRVYLNASPMGTQIPLPDLIEFYESLGFKVFHREANNAEMYMII